MTRILYPSPAHFLSDNRSYLDANPIATQLNQGNAMAHRDEPCRPGLLFGRYDLHGQPVLLFGNTAPWNLCLNAPSPDAPALAAAGQLARDLQAENIPIAGVTGQDVLCQAFIQAYGGPFQLRSALDIMVLRRLIDPPPVAGRVRKARLSDLETLARWMCAFLQEALHQPADLAQRLEEGTDRKNIENGARWVLEAPDGTLLSTAGTSRPMAHGISITAVYTPPEHRNRGYCQNTVASVCREQFAQGMDYCTLFVDRLNPVSNRAYRKLGFEVLTDSSEYKKLYSQSSLHRKG